MKYGLLVLLALCFVVPVHAATIPHEVDLTWTASVTPGATYVVLKGTASIGPFTPLVSGLSGTAYNDKGLAAATVYCYEVVAKSTGGIDSDPTPPICPMTPADKTGPASNVSAVPK